MNGEDRTPLTSEYVRELFDYDAETGRLSWKVYGKGRRKDLAVGVSGSYGYPRVKLKKSIHLVHRVVWLWWYGYTPENDIDHIDRDKSNNRIENLREVTQQCNSRNRGGDKRNTSGVTGVSWFKRTGKWCASIVVGRRRKNIAYRLDFTEAVAHRLAAEQCLNWAGCNSNSSAYQYMKKETKK